MITSDYKINGATRLREQKEAALDQLEAACEALGRLKEINLELFYTVVENTALNIEAISDMLRGE